MNESSEVEETKAKACAIIGMHATASKKYGAMSAGVIIASVVIAIIARSFWPIVIGVIASYCVSYLIKLSCYRRAEQATGLSRAAQDHIMGLYKHDKQFAAAVERARAEAGGTTNSRF